MARASASPWFRLVRAARERGLQVVPIPGPSAFLCALSASGLPADRFLFLGFAPRTGARRRTLFQQLAGEPGTLVFYESSHRVHETLSDLCAVFGASRRVVLARELTKVHETFLTGSACALADRLERDPVQAKGEHVLIVEGASPDSSVGDVHATRLLKALLEELPVKQAVGIAARVTGMRRNDLYRLALSLS